MTSRLVGLEFPDAALASGGGPSGEPVSLVEAKAHLVQDHSADDTRISALITVAREYVEGRTWRALMTQTWDFYYDRFPDGSCPIAVPLPPLASVGTVAYTDPDGDAQTMATGTFRVLAAATPGLVEPAYNTAWPTTRDARHAIRVRAAVGFGGASAVPAIYKHAIKLLVAHWYENPEAVLVGTVSKKLEFALDALLGLDHAREMIA